MIKRTLQLVADEAAKWFYEQMIKAYRSRFGAHTDYGPGTEAHGYRMALIDVARAVFTPIGNDFDTMVDRDIKGY